MAPPSTSGEIARVSTSSSESFDVIVAGLGSVGSAACYHLSKRGARVLGLERCDSIPHTRGSHHGHSRMIRQAYFEHPDYVPLLQRAYQLWHELEAEAGGGILHLAGGLYVGGREGPIVSGSSRAAREHSLDHQLLDAAAIGERFPGFSVRPDHVAFFEEDAGFLVPERAIEAHATHARRLGANLNMGEALRSWRAGTDHVEVVTDRATYRAGHLIAASGAWSAQVATELGIELAVTRQVLAWFELLAQPEQFLPGTFPCWFFETDPPFGHYGFPVMPGDPGLKVALHKPGEPVSTASRDRGVEPPRDDEIAALREVLDEFLPGSAGELTQACTCLYTNSPDGHFILGGHPSANCVSVACGLSGHGFKFASVLGEVLAQLALDGESTLPIGFLSPGRFGGNGSARVGRHAEFSTMFEVGSQQRPPVEMSRSVILPLDG